MFEVILFSKVPMEVNIFNTKFIVSPSAQKLLKFDCKKSFSFEYNFVGKNSIVYSANFDFLNDNLTSKNKSIKILKFEENKFSIEILQKNSEFLQKKVKKIQSLEKEFNFYLNGLVEIETKDEMLFSKQYDFEILDADVVNLKQNYYALKLYGVNSDACIILNENFVDIDYFENSIVETTEQGYSVLTDLKDIAGHGVVRVYEIEQTSVLIDEYSVYLSGHPKMPSNDNIVPIFFAECIKAKDYSLAKKMLHDELKRTAKQEHLKHFFGDFVGIDWDRFSDDKCTICFEYSKNDYNYLKKYVFELKDGKIYNIS